MPTSRDNDVIVLSCDEDKELCEKAHVEKVYTAELLLTGILRQKLDLDQYPFQAYKIVPVFGNRPAKFYLLSDQSFL